MKKVAFWGVVALYLCLVIRYSWNPDGFAQSLAAIGIVAAVIQACVNYGWKSASALLLICLAITFYLGAKPLGCAGPHAALAGNTPLCQHGLNPRHAVSDGAAWQRDRSIRAHMECCRFARDSGGNASLHHGLYVAIGGDKARGRRLAENLDV
jgi:hypothetical protein